jgi:hypothetical protein
MLALSHIRSCRPTDNAILFLLTFLLSIEGVESIQTCQSNRCSLTASSGLRYFIELAYGLDIPDEMIADPKVILRNLADEIQRLPKIDRGAYDKKLLKAQMLLRAGMEN